MGHNCAKEGKSFQRGAKLCRGACTRGGGCLQVEVQTSAGDTVRIGASKRAQGAFRKMGRARAAQARPDATGAKLGPLVSGAGRWWCLVCRGRMGDAGGSRARGGRARAETPAGALL